MITTTKDNTKCIFAHGGMSISTNGYTKPCCQIKKGEGEKADKGQFITAKSTFPPKVMDKGKRRWDEDTKIGNGSAVKCSVDLYDWSMNGKTGVSAGIKAVMVTNLIGYEGDDELEAEEEVEDEL